MVGRDGTVQTFTGDRPIFHLNNLFVNNQNNDKNNDNHHDKITYGGWSHQLGDDVDWHGEDDCAVVLGRDAVQRLQVAELEIA